MLVVLKPERVIIITLALFVFVLLKGQSYWKDIWRMCWRMKWLWLSLLILYGWFIPGSPLFFTNSIPLFLVPSSEGLIMGLLRGLVLLNIISAVVLIIKSTSKESLIVSIIWLMTPLRLFRVNTARFSARLVLTMERVTDTENEIRTSLSKNNQSTSIFQRGIDSIARLLVNIEQQAGDSPTVLVSLPQIEMPALVQWLLPLLLFVGLYMI